MAKKKTAFTMTSGQLWARLFDLYKRIIPRYLRAQKVEAYENPDKRVIAGKWTNNERKWAERFEQLEYAIERGNITAAITHESSLRKRELTGSELKVLRHLKQVKERCNPAKAEVWRKKEEESIISNRALPEGMYTASDWVRARFSIDLDTGEETEIEGSLSAEDALIEALDAAKAHNVSLDEFVSNPKYHTPDRKAGRPRKEVDLSKLKANRAVEKVVEDFKVAEATVEEVKVKVEPMQYAATTYTMHGNLILDMNFVVQAPNGEQWVLDQHGRLHTLTAYVNRKITESIVTHIDVSYPDQLQHWVLGSTGRSVVYEAV